jgi:hypothetical protein
VVEFEGGVHVDAGELSDQFLATVRRGFNYRHRRDRRKVGVHETPSRAEPILPPPTMINS